LKWERLPAPEGWVQQPSGVSLARAPWVGMKTNSRMASSAM